MDYSRSKLRSSKENDDEIRSLKQKIRDLDSELKTIRIKTQTMAGNDAKSGQCVTEQSKQKNQTDIEDSKRGQHMAERELVHTQLDQQLDQIDAKMSDQYTKDSVNKLCKVVATDRKWLEAEMTRRASALEAIKHKNEFEFVEKKRRLSEDLK